MSSANGQVPGEKRMHLLGKLGRGGNKYEMFHVWFNPFDPEYLRYSKDPDFRGVKVAPLRNAGSVKLTWTVDRPEAKAATLILDCHRKHRLQIEDGRRARWHFYFQTPEELESFRSALTEAQSRGPVPAPLSDEEKKWFDEMYGEERRGGSDEPRPATPPVSSPGPTQISIRVDLPLNMGVVWFDATTGGSDPRFFTLKRFKERVFECVHLAYHSGPPRGETVGERNFSENENGTISAAAEFNSRRKCKDCNGNLRQVASRAAFKQEEVLTKGPDHFVLQRTAVHQVPTGMTDWLKTFTSERYDFGNEAPSEDPAANRDRFKGHGIYADPDSDPKLESEADARSLLRALKFRRPDKTATPPPSLPKDDPASKLDERDRERPEDDWDTYLVDEDVMFQSVIDNILSTGGARNKSCVVRLALAPLRDVPAVSFRVSIPRYTRERDALEGEFSLYTCVVTQGNHLQWEFKRRYSDFLALDAGLRGDAHIVAWAKRVAAAYGIATPSAKLPAHLVPASSTLASTTGAAAAWLSRSADSLRRRGPTVVTRPSPLTGEQRVAAKHMVPALPAKPARSTPDAEAAKMRELTTYLNAVLRLAPVRDNPPAVLLEFLGAMHRHTGAGAQICMTSPPPPGVEDKRVIHVNSLKTVAEFGDIVLFRSVNRLAGWQRRVTGGDFDHVGIVARKNGEYCLLEATGEGVTTYPLESRLVSYADGFCDILAIRKLTFERTKARYDALATFTSRVEGKPYSLSIGKLAAARSSTRAVASGLGSPRAYFCSELVAEALKEMGLLKKGKKLSYYLPHHFVEGGGVEKRLESAVFGELLVVDCKLVEVEFSSLV